MSSSSVLSFYDEMAEAYIERTSSLDMSAIRGAFMGCLEGPRVLDAGCGSGRDALAFKEAGLDVVAFDGSPRMAALAAARTGLPVQHLLFEDVTWERAFDGAWACASLVHMADPELHSSFRALLRALRTGGVLYASFKVGDGARVDENGRFFNDFTSERLRKALESCGAEVLSTWENDKVGGPPVRWLNVLART